MAAAALSWESVGVKLPSAICLATKGIPTCSKMGITFTEARGTLPSGVERRPPLTPP